MIDPDKIMSPTPYVDKNIGPLEGLRLVDFGNDVFGSLVLVFDGENGKLKKLKIGPTPMGGLNLKVIDDEVM